MTFKKRDFIGGTSTSPASDSATWSNSTSSSGSAQLGATAGVFQIVGM